MKNNSNLKDYLSNLSDDERLLMRQKALESVEKEKADNAHLRQDFADKGNWGEMASEVKLRMAPYYKASDTVKYFNRALKAVGKDRAWWTEQTGFKNPKEFYAANPTYPAYALQGLVLEMALS